MIDLRLTTIAILALAAGLAMWRTARRRGWRDLAVWTQAPAAILLYCLLFPPTTSLRGDALTVMTPGATAQQRGSAPAGQPIVALPDALAPNRAEAVPDLATALRRHPAVGSLTVIGGGLPPRDQSAAAALAVQFQPAPALGLIELQAPASVLLGRQWALRGRAAAPTKRVELHDPSGAVADAADVDAEGRFALSAAARGEGTAKFELHLLNDEQIVIDSISVPIVVHSGQPMTIIVRAGAANPELKYWRRWAADAGITASVSTGLTDGISQHDGDTQLSPAALAQADLVIIDTRAWASLSADEKSALQAAVENGLGLLLRADGPMDAATAAQWGELGYQISAADTRAVTLDRRTGLRNQNPFTEAPLTIEAPDGVSMLEADDGEVLAWRHAQGQGRVGLWRLVDSYRLVLLGESARYSTLWATALGQLARPRPAPPPEPKLPINAWVDQRAVICGLGKTASVLAPADGAAVTLLVDTGGCAAYWPAVAGWHTLQTGGGSWPFYVRAIDDGAKLRLALDRSATENLVGPSDAVSTTLTLKSPLPRWPFFIAWLLLTAGIWWRERRV